jgi:hypothetical protein
MAFEPPPECEGAAGDIPDPSIAFFKADVFADAEV